MVGIHSMIIIIIIVLSLGGLVHICMGTIRFQNTALYYIIYTEMQYILNSLKVYYTQYNKQGL